MQRVFEAWRELRRGAVRKLNSDFYGHREDALDPAQMDILEVVASQPSWRMNHLALALHLDPSTVTRSIERLAANKLVTRLAAADDGRGVRVRATKAGHAVCNEIAPGRRAVMREVLRDMPEREREQLATLLEKMVSGVSAYATRLGSSDGEWSATSS
jgi:DNA-binding MarR family transcriptional regulator